MTTYPTAPRLPFSEEEELELAAELLAANEASELDLFLGELFRRSGANPNWPLRAPVAQRLGGLLKGAVRSIFPQYGRGGRGGQTPGLSGWMGRLGAGAGRMLGLELEGLSPEDQELTAARQLVRLAGAAAAEAAKNSTSPDPGAVAAQTLARAAHWHAPGLLATPAGPEAPSGCGCGCGGHAGRDGRWERRGEQIILYDV